MNKKLTKSGNRIIAGVCGGLAEYFNIDPTLMRVLYVILTFGTAFAGCLIYLVLLLIMPEK
jgi:phage shock protein C